MEDFYKKIFELAKPLLKKGRLWDLEHTNLSIKFMEEILIGENANNKKNVLIPAIILHDIGWSGIGNEKNIEWSKKTLRIEHMDLGAEMAEKILKKINYPKKLIFEIKRLIKNHDNFYLGIEPQTDDEKMLRDADSCFIFTNLSFWKDYDVKVIKQNEDISPLDFLGKLEKKIGKKYTKTGEKINKRLIQERIKEIKLKQNGRFL
jgi:hypothetical protein